MQNPFHRLKHYRPGENDSKENHATEALAACLVFSEPFRAKFLEFLFGGKGKVPKALADAGQVEIATQHSTRDFGTIDLFLRTGELRTDRFGVVVEIKVSAKEDERHKTQLDNYDSWLESGFAEGERALFTLVRNPDPQFKHSKAQRREWGDLFKMIEEFIEDCDSSTDKALLKAFSDYLTLEGVVDNMDYSKLVDYGKGWAADKALESLQRQIKEKLQPNIGDLETAIDAKIGRSPCLLFGRSSWARVFGPGFNNKVSVWFRTPITEGSNCKECQFVVEVQLWSRWHRNNWQSTAKHLPDWLKYFETKKINNCEIGSLPRRGPWVPWDDKQALNQDNWYLIRFGAPIPIDAQRLDDIDGLARDVAERVEECLKLVDGLPLTQ